MSSTMEAPDASYLQPQRLQAVANVQSNLEVLLQRAHRAPQALRILLLFLLPNEPLQKSITGRALILIIESGLAKTMNKSKVTHSCTEYITTDKGGTALLRNQSDASRKMTATTPSIPASYAGHSLAVPAWRCLKSSFEMQH